MRTLILGANGQIGFQTAKQLYAAGRHEVLAMIRDDSQRDRFEDLGINTVCGDLLKPIDDAVEGCEAVIFAAGSGGKTGKDLTVLVDQLGAIRTAVAALTAGAKRFVLLSGLAADRDATDDPIPHWRRAKGRADDFVRTMPQAFDGESLDWTIVCPGTLHDDGASGIELIEADGQGKTSRANVAAVLARCLDEPATIGRTLGIIDGEQHIAEALSLGKP